MSFDFQTYAPVLIAGSGALVVAVVGGLATDIGPWYAALRKPRWQPPAWLFGPVWTTIYSLTAAAAVLAWWALPVGASGRALVIALFAFNGVLNALWSLLFFRVRRPDWALAELGLLWFSVLSLIVLTARIDPWAPWLLVPYIAWVTFAGLLNAAIVRLNRPDTG